MMSTLALGLTLAVVVGSAAAARPRFTGSFPWQRIPTMCQTGFSGRFVRSNMTGTGRHDDAVVRFLAENYDLIVAGDTQPGTASCLEPKVKEFADRVASFNPHTRVLVCKDLGHVRSLGTCMSNSCFHNWLPLRRGERSIFKWPPPARRPSTPCARLGHFSPAVLRGRRGGQEVEGRVIGGGVGGPWGTFQE